MLFHFSRVHSLLQECAYQTVAQQLIILAVRCSGNMLTKPLSSNGRPFRLRYSGFQV
jgi:hypothetical protein